MKQKTTRFALTLLLSVLTMTQTAWATTTSTINVGGTDYTLFTGFTATAGTAGTLGYTNFVDGNTSTMWFVSKGDDFEGGTEDPAYVEFHADAAFIPKGYVLTCNHENAGFWKPYSWALKAKLNENDDWTEIHSSNSPLGNGSRFEIACNNNDNKKYQYFRFEIYDVGTTDLSKLNELEFYGSVPAYTHLTVKAATCTETGIKQDCYQRNSDGKYFTDETGTTELQESEVIAPMIPHSGDHHDATDVNIEYWQCSVCSKYFSDEACTTEITEEDTKIYRTITIDDAISGLVTSSRDQALTGETVALWDVSPLIDVSTLQVNSGSVTLTDAGNGTYTFTVPAADVTVTASILSTYSITLPANMAIVSATNAADSNGKYISGTVIKFAASLGYEATNVSDGTNTLEPDADGIYTVTVAEADINITATTESSNTIYLARATSDFTAVDGNILIGSTSHTVTIANNAKITLSDVTITGGIVCAGTAEITLVGTNSISGLSRYDCYTAGIQVGGSGTTLTIKGNGSLTANGGSQSAGIGLSRAWDVNATGGDIIIEGGNITATGNGMGAGIGTGVCYGKGTDNTATIGNITIKAGTVRAISGTNNDYPGNGIGKGGAYNSGHAVVGTITIYDGIDMVDASSISESIVYMHVDNETETDVTANKIDYFTIIEDGNRRVIAPKDDTDYTITIADDIEHGSIACAATTAKFGDNVTITATPALGYRFSRLVVKDAQNNDVASTDNSFFIPKSNVTVSAVFEQGTHGTTEFAWGYYEDDFVKEATIYDGVTTVNLQQGKEYCIGKDYNEFEPGKGYCENTFRLDEDTYAEGRDIPYSGGTGIFQNVDVTRFSLNNDGEAGYYDITMTEADNGKWNVSILKTAGQMDVVPDQTYTGCEITPEPLVIAGSLNLTKGTDYVYSYENNENVGTAKVIATFQDNYASLGYVEKEFKIVKSMTNNDISITIPSQTYTGSAIEPAVTVKDGETPLTLGTDYEVAYSNNVNAGTATATITGKGNYSDSKEATFTISPRLARQAGAVYVYEDQNGMTALLDGTSVDPVDIDYNHNIIVNHVTSNRVFTPGMASTVMLPFNYTCNGEEGGMFYKFVGVKKENDKWVATMQETGNDTNKQGTLEANTPYLFMPAATTMTFPNINGSVWLFTRGGGSGGNCETADPGSHWTFKGTYRYIEWTAGTTDPNFTQYAEEIGRAYGFAGVAQTDINVGDFVKVKSGAKIRPMRAYLLWNDMPNAANARSFTRGAAAADEELPQSITVRLVGSNGETTAIGTLDTKTGEMTFDSEAWYTLDGVRLSGKPTKKGLYINNGKKIVIK